jgi:hypothetical protein
MRRLGIDRYRGGRRRRVPGRVQAFGRLRAVEGQWPHERAAERRWAVRAGDAGWSEFIVEGANNGHGNDNSTC